MPRLDELKSPLSDGLPPALRSDPHPGAARVLLHGVYDALWYGAMVVAAPWLLWRSARDPAFAAMVRERAGWAPPPPHPRPADGPRVLVHGVSVGEVKGAAPLVRALAERLPTVDIAISSTTNTGLTVAREVFRDRRVVRFPADTTRAVRRFLDRVRPELVILVELEIWPNFLRECNRRGVPVAVVMGRITESAHGRYRLFRHLLPQFDRLSLICVQDELYARRFRDLAVDPARVVVTGSMKADRLNLGPADAGPELTRFLGGRPGQIVLVAGSTHDPEEVLVAEAWRAGAPGARLVLVPRHPERAPEVVRALERDGVSAQRLTDLRAGLEEPDPDRPCIADTIGELERIYGLADVVFVGGSLAPHGGHDLLEPAAQGKAVVIGPHVTNFAQETALFVERGACLQVPDAAALARAFHDLAADPAARARMAHAGLAVVGGQKGATARTLTALGAVLGTPEFPPPASRTG